MQADAQLRQKNITSCYYTTQHYKDRGPTLNLKQQILRDCALRHETTVPNDVLRDKKPKLAM
jgi:hypothetical protein